MENIPVDSGLISVLIRVDVFSRKKKHHSRVSRTTRRVYRYYYAYASIKNTLAEGWTYIYSDGKLKRLLSLFNFTVCI